MKQKIPHKLSWINNQWGSANELLIPLNDRGLTLGDGIFETILIWQGRPKLLNEHLTRLREGAALLRMAPPPKYEWLECLIEEGIRYGSLQQQNAALRLNWSRGSSLDRGINLSENDSDKAKHRLWLELTPLELSFEPKTAIISRNEQRNANSQISRIKIFSYLQSIQARRDAQISGYDEAILLSTNGEICCGTTSNLIIKRKSEWLTPSINTGCLPGIMRQQGLEKGLFQEAQLLPQIEDDDELILINSLSCHPITKLNNKSLNVFHYAKELWLNLINES